MTSLEIRNLSKDFGAGPSLALDDINLDVDSGELLVLLGPSGSGKTTLLRCIAGLVQPSAGAISFAGEIVADHAAGISIPPSKRHLGMVFQNFALWPHMSVADNVAYPLRAQKWQRHLVAPRVSEMLELVHCEDLGERLPATLSGGQQQRIALARALAARPAMILFDEPLSNLDALLRVELRSQLRLIHRKTSFTGVYVTHDQVEALGLGTRIVVMNRGHIEQVGAPEEVYYTPSTEFAAEFMGMSNAVVVEGSGSGWESSAGRVVDRGFLPRASAGRKLSLRFRPEDVYLNSTMAANDSREWGNAPTIGRAKVVDRSFQGEHIEFLLSVGDMTLKAKVSGKIDRLDVGDEAFMTVEPEHLAVFESSKRLEHAHGAERQQAVNG